MDIIMASKTIKMFWMQNYKDIYEKLPFHVLVCLGENVGFLSLSKYIHGVEWNGAPGFTFNTFRNTLIA